MWYLDADGNDVVTPRPEAEVMAQVTGATGATCIVERRDPVTGQLVTVSVDTHNTDAPLGWCGTASHPTQAHARRAGCIAFSPA